MKSYSKCVGVVCFRAEVCPERLVDVVSTQNCVHPSCTRGEKQTERSNRGNLRTTICRDTVGYWLFADGRTVWDGEVAFVVEATWNVMAHPQKPDFVFRAKRTSPFKSAGGRQFSRLLAAEVRASAVVMLDTPCSEVVWRVLATHCIRQFPLHFPHRTSPCAITFQLDSTLSRALSFLFQLYNSS